MDESESDDSLYLSVVSETERVPVILERVAQFARRQGVVGTDGLLLVVRELLMNAIVHGNESDRSRMALIRVARRGSLFEVQVDDEGEGFDQTIPRFSSSRMTSKTTCPTLSAPICWMRGAHPDAGRSTRSKSARMQRRTEVRVA